MADKFSALYTQLLINAASKDRAKQIRNSIRCAMDVCVPGVAVVDSDYWVFGTVIPAGATLLVDGRWRTVNFSTAGSTPGMNLRMRRLDNGAHSRDLSIITANVGTTSYATHSVTPTNFAVGNGPALFMVEADSVPEILWSAGAGLPTGTNGRVELELYFMMDN
jgi:hypothetical protein